MRPVLFAVLAALAAPALAQTPPPAAPQPDILTGSNAQAMALLAKAKSELRPGTAMAPAQPLVRAGPFRAVVEYRGAPTPASTHETEGELLNILSGSGTIIIGGKLNEEKRTNPTNLSGTGITGGKTFTLTPGDYVFIPANTAHYFATVGPQGLGVVTHKVPIAAPAK
jgi:mannose-6-phosphate isomerase-like protein (cupin superfamily)